MNKQQLKQSDIYHAYADTFLTVAGEIVLEDLVGTFDGVYSGPLLDLIEGIPHPYKAYVEKGMRIVIEGIKQAADNGKHLRGITNDGTSERTESGDGFND